MLNRLVLPLVDVVFPRVCLACEADLLPTRRRWLCTRCLARIEPLGPDPCPTCAGPLGRDATPSACPACGRLRPRFDGAIAVGRYDGLLRELVLRLKYGRDPAMAWPLGDLLAETVGLWERGLEADVVVPVPQTFLRRLRRGFNQAELIAAELAGRLSVPLSRGALRRTGRPPAQAGLSRTDRLRAPRGTIAVRRRRAVAGRTVLLVDDVLTTGGTVSEAARMLKAAGARQVLVAVAARA
jgi:ComF family protein